MARITRRQVLQASGLALGAAAGATFLRGARAGTPAGARVVLVVEGNGVYPRAFVSEAAKAAINQTAKKTITTDMNFHNLYGHDKPLMVTGDPLDTPNGSLAGLAMNGKSLVNRSAVVLGLSGTVAGGGHSSFQGGLSCSRGDSQKTPAATIDAVLAASLGTKTPFDAVRLGVTGSKQLSYSLCAYGPGRPAPITVDPTDAYKALFTSILGTDPTAIAERKDTLDFARADVTAALASFGPSAEERLKLERYLEALKASQARQDLLVQMQGAVAPLVPPGPAADPRYTSTDPLARLAVQFDLATTCLIGGLANVVVLSSGPGGGLDLVYESVLPKHFSGLDQKMSRHSLQHGNTQAAYQAAIMDVTAEHVNLIAKMARALDNVPEGNGTMLDNTIIVYLSDNGEKHHSEAKEWPMLLVGGSNLGMKTDGRTIVYPGWNNPSNRQASNLFNTLGHAIGNTELNEFGNEGALRIAKGPLDELFG
jgi:hypothetical protein